jgi:hypothetical protein
LTRRYGPRSTAQGLSHRGDIAGISTLRRKFRQRPFDEHARLVNVLECGALEPFFERLTQRSRGNKRSFTVPNVD